MRAITSACSAPTAPQRDGVTSMAAPRASLWLTSATADAGCDRRACAAESQTDTSTAVSAPAQTATQPASVAQETTAIRGRAPASSRRPLSLSRRPTARWVRRSTRSRRSRIASTGWTSPGSARSACAAFGRTSGNSGSASSDRRNYRGRETFRPPARRASLPPRPAWLDPSTSRSGQAAAARTPSSILHSILLPGVIIHK